MMRMFKVDMTAISGAADVEYDRLEEPENPGEPLAYAACAELSRQIRDAGGPDGDIGAQLGALLASHKAMAEAGEALPDVAAVEYAFCNGASTVPYEHGKSAQEQGGYQHVLDLFRPIVARLRQERDEARRLHGFAQEEIYRLRPAVSAPEPSGDMVERLARIARASWDGKGFGKYDVLVRAVLFEMTKLGASGLGIKAGRTEEETGVRVESAIETGWACNCCGQMHWDSEAPCDRKWCASRAAPVLAAKDMRNAALSERIAALEAENHQYAKDDDEAQDVLARADKAEDEMSTLRARAELAEAKLARVLDTPCDEVESVLYDLDRWATPHEAAKAFLALIRSRLSDGAEDATCSTASIGITKPPPPPPPPAVVDEAPFALGGLSLEQLRVAYTEAPAGTLLQQLLRDEIARRTNTL